MVFIFILGDNPSTWVGWKFHINLVNRNTNDCIKNYTKPTHFLNNCGFCWLSLVHHFCQKNYKSDKAHSITIGFVMLVLGMSPDWKHRFFLSNRNCQTDAEMEIRFTSDFCRSSHNCRCIQFFSHIIFVLLIMWYRMSI